MEEALLFLLLPVAISLYYVSILDYEVTTELCINCAVMIMSLSLSYGFIKRKRMKRAAMFLAVVCVARRDYSFAIAMWIIFSIILWKNLKSTEIKCSKPDNKRNRVLLCVCGSVAAVKTPDIVNLLVKSNCFVDVVFSKSGKFFMNVEYKGDTPANRLAPILYLKDESGTKFVQTWTDEDEWNEYKRVGDDVVHINLAKRNRVLLVAPLDANTLARLALGLCPNLLTCTVRAWNWSSSSPILAPAMNTQMWNQNITKTHLDTLKERGAAIVSPQVKTLACGDHGKGAMADPEDIVRVVLETLQRDT